MTALIYQDGVLYTDSRITKTTPGNRDVFNEVMGDTSHPWHFLLKVVASSPRFDEEELMVTLKGGHKFTDWTNVTANGRPVNQSAVCGSYGIIAYVEYAMRNLGVSDIGYALQWAHDTLRHAGAPVDISNCLCVLAVTDVEVVAYVYDFITHQVKPYTFPRTATVGIGSGVTEQMDADFVVAAYRASEHRPMLKLDRISNIQRYYNSAMLADPFTNNDVQMRRC